MAAAIAVQPPNTLVLAGPFHHAKVTSVEAIEIVAVGIGTGETGQGPVPVLPAWLLGTAPPCHCGPPCPAHVPGRLFGVNRSLYSIKIPYSFANIQRDYRSSQKMNISRFLGTTVVPLDVGKGIRSEEHTSELQSPYDLV